MGSKMRGLLPGYTPEVDTVSEHAWHQILEQFEDANVYQTWSYDEVRCGRENISHLVLKKDGDIVAVAQARILKLPFLKVGIAYVRWGPLWRRRKGDSNPETFHQAIRALRNEYACRRGLVLRLYPALFRDDSSCFASILNEEGFASLGTELPDRTLLLDLTRPLEDLRTGLRPHWRRALKTAEKSGLEIIEGSDEELFGRFVRMYREMIGRKRFAEPNDINEFRLIQNRLPAKFKMRILLCMTGGDLCAGLVCSAIGNTAFYLFGATSTVGLKSRGSYLLHWKLIGWLKQNGVAIYDLHGINPELNPGTYRFKADLCGNNARDVFFLGRFDSYSNVPSYAWVFCGDRLRTIYRTLRRKVAEGTPRAAAQDPGYSALLTPQSD